MEQLPGPLGIDHGPKLEHGIKGLVRLAVRHLCATQGDEARCELDPCLGGPEGCAATQEAIHGILQQHPGPVMLASGRRHLALGQIGNGPQRRCADESLDLPQLLEERDSLVELAAPDPRLEEQFEGWDAV